MLLSYFLEVWWHLGICPRLHSEKAAWGLNRLWLPSESLLILLPLQRPCEDDQVISPFRILQRLPLVWPEANGDVQERTIPGAVVTGLWSLCKKESKGEMGERK